MKKMKKVVVLMSLLFIGIFQFGCGNSSDPSGAKANLEFRAVSNQYTLGGARVAVSGVEFTTVLIGVKELEFETTEENDREDEGDFEDQDEDGEDDNEKVEFEGSYVVDLLTGTSTPDFGFSATDTNVYDEIEVELGPVLDGGNSIFVAFSFIPQGASDPVNVEFSTSSKIEFEIENESGFSIENGISTILLLFDLDAFMDGIDLSNAVADQDGVIRINANSNTEIASQIADNLDSVMDAGEDDDDDGEIDEDEEDENDGDD